MDLCEPEKWRKVERALAVRGIYTGQERCYCEEAQRLLQSFSFSFASLASLTLLKTHSCVSLYLCLGMLLRRMVALFVM